jgi:hypothetical protein
MMRSASVDLPWSMWAMMEKLRMLFIKFKASYSKKAPGRAPFMTIEARVIPGILPDFRGESPNSAVIGVK